MRSLVLASLLNEVVATSAEVTKTASRKSKTSLLADLFRRLQVSELGPAIGLLIGQPRQRRIGVGYVSVFNVKTDPAGQPTLTVSDVDETLTALQESIGPGSQKLRSDLLNKLMGRATATEQAFLRQVIT